MADEKEPAAGEDPWAGLESESLPDMGEGFDFSFEESAEAADAADAPPSIDLSGLSPENDADAANATEEPATTTEAGADDGDVDEWLEESDSAAAPELSVFQSGDEEVAEDDGDLMATATEENVSLETGSEHAGITAGVADESSPVAEAAADSDDLGGDDPFAAAIAAEMFDTSHPEGSAAEAAEADDAFEPGAEAGEDTDDAAGSAGGMFNFDGNIDSENDAESPDAHSEGADEEIPSFEDAAGTAAPLIAAESVDEPQARAKKGSKPTRVAPPKKKKPSMVGQMIGMVVGGAMSIPIVLVILWWGVGKDPLKVAPMVPDALGFLLPEKLRSGGQVATTSGSGNARAPSLDDVLGSSADLTPDLPDVAAVDPEPVGDQDPVVPEPDLIDTLGPDVVARDPEPDADTTGDDELMALLDEETTPPVEPAPPAAAPEPEPLDITALQGATDAALAALASVEAASDPTDPVHKKLLVECYKAMAAYAQELAMLERVAADTGRPLAAMPAPAIAMADAVIGRPELFNALSRLTRDWLSYPKRTSDGVLTPVTFVSARKVGPYWRAEVTVAERPLVVLTRSEPVAAQGDTVLVTGLSVDKDVVWATDVRPAKADDPFGL